MHHLELGAREFCLSMKSVRSFAVTRAYLAQNPPKIVLFRCFKHMATDNNAHTERLDICKYMYVSHSCLVSY